MGEHRRGMRPAGAGRPSPQKPIVGISEERGNAAARPLSVGAAEFSPTLGPRTRGTAGTHSDGGNSPSYSLDSRRQMGRSKVVVPTATEAGSVALSSVAGTIAPVDFAGISVPAVAGMKFSAVAEVHSSAVDVDDDTSVVRASEQRSDVSLDPRTAPGIVDRPMAGISVPEPLEHSLLDVALERKSMEGMSALEPLEHSVLEVTRDGRPTRGISVMEPLEHLIPDVVLVRGVSSFIKMAASDPLEYSGLNRADDVGPKLVSLEPLEHSVLVAPWEESDISVTDVADVKLRVEMMSACLPRVFSDHRGEDVSLLDVRPEAEQAQPEAGEAIVVGAVSSAAPWFLTGE